MVKSLRWIASHPGILAAFALGALVGLSFILPFSPWVLPDSHASLIGAALGAAIAVGGAAFYAEFAQWRYLDASRQQLIENLAIVAVAIDAVRKLAALWRSKDFDADLTENAASELDAFWTVYWGCRRRNKALRQEYLRLGPAGAKAFADSMPAFKNIKDLVGAPIRHAGVADRQSCIDACNAIFVHDKRFERTASRLRDAIKGLERDAGVFR